MVNVKHITRSSRATFGGFTRCYVHSGNQGKDVMQHNNTKTHFARLLVSRSDHL